MDLDRGYLAFEDQHIDRTVDSIIKFPGGTEEIGRLISKGILLYLEGKRELSYPASVEGLTLSPNTSENEMACKMLELYILAETYEMCRMSEPATDGSPFDKVQVMWVLMKIYNALYDLYDIGTYLPDDLRKSITEARAATARDRMRLDC